VTAPCLCIFGTVARDLGAALSTDSHVFAERPTSGSLLAFLVQRRLFWVGWDTTIALAPSRSPSVLSAVESHTGTAGRLGSLPLRKWNATVRKTRVKYERQVVLLHLAAGFFFFEVGVISANAAGHESIPLGSKVRTNRH
jgi:hypothetical protein